MSHLYYRHMSTMDPEERLEEAVLYKALHDEFGEGLTLVGPDEDPPLDGIFLGRGRKGEGHMENLLGSPSLRYWNDPAFLKAISRSFVLTDLDGAQAEVKRLHDEGKDAFVKSVKQKHYVSRFPRGRSFQEAMDAMMFSFMDLENCLLVQEAVDMKFERRFLVMNGEVVTQSPVAWHLTPMSRGWIMDETGFGIEDLHYRTPEARTARFSPSATARMTEVARSIASDTPHPHLCIDLAILGDDPERDPIEAVEFNPMQPGGVGLYGCDPRKIAQALWGAMEPELREAVEARRDGNVPARAEIDDTAAAQEAREMARNGHPLIKGLFDEDELARDYEILLSEEKDEPYEDESVEP